MMKLVSNFFQLPWVEKLHSVEAVFFLFYAWGMTMVIPTRKLMKILGHHDIHPIVPDEIQCLTAKDVGRAIRRMAPYMPCRSMCLEQSIAGAAMLRWRKIPSSLTFGACMENGQLKAHAWLRSGDIWVTGQRGVKKFGQLVTFIK